MDNKSIKEKALFVTKCFAVPAFIILASIALIIGITIILIAIALAVALSPIIIPAKIIYDKFSKKPYQETMEDYYPKVNSNLTASKTGQTLSPTSRQTLPNTHFFFGQDEEEDPNTLRRRFTHTPF